jgi:DNA-binding MarR family transcriptional regulator
VVHYTETVLWSIRRADQATHHAKERALRDLGISPALQQALAVVSECYGITSAELARRCQVTAQTMTSTVNKLEASGLLIREPHPVHGTLIELRLTPAGQKLFERAAVRVAALDDALAGSVTPRDVAKLKRLLEQVATAADAL